MPDWFLSWLGVETGVEEENDDERIRNDDSFVITTWPPF